MEPFKNLGMTTLTMQNTGGTDHLSFDAVGLPGFQFIQDEVEYDTRTHHSNMDVYERLQAADMMKNAVIVASFVYHAANRDQMLPRKPLPKAEPPKPDRRRRQGRRTRHRTAHGTTDYEDYGRRDTRDVSAPLQPVRLVPRELSPSAPTVRVSPVFASTRLMAWLFVSAT